MNATALASAWRVWVPGVAAPVACLGVDYLHTEFVSRYAPAGLGALAAIGIACLAISRYRRQDPIALATGGALWLAGGLTLAIGVLFVVLSSLVLLVLLAASGPGAASSPFMLLALLGFAPGLAQLWTGIVYLREANALTKARSTPLGAALCGALGAALTLVTVEIADTAFIATRLAPLDSGASHTWEHTLQSLAAYPLCGYRCKERICDRLFAQFGVTGGGELRNVPRPLDEAFKRSFGHEATEFCLSLG
jgi:hypothetical protein